jgi:hypothetical protein
MINLNKDKTMANAPYNVFIEVQTLDSAHIKIVKMKASYLFNRKLNLLKLLVFR